MKLIIPAAGMGSRMWPITRSIPKYLLPAGNHNAIDYILLEAIISGVDEVVIITNHDNQILKDYFYKPIPDNFQFDYLRFILDKIQINFITQKERIGLGYAVLSALNNLNLKKEERVLISLPDMLIFDKNYKLLNLTKNLNTDFILVKKVPLEDTSLYGIIKKNVNNIENIIEKPGIKDTPSDLAVIGRYFLDGNLLKESLGQIVDNYKFNQEVPLTEALNIFLQTKKIIALEQNMKCFDIGSFKGFYEANKLLQNFKVDLNF